MTTIIYSAPQIQNILALMSIILFMYAVLGINLFSTVMYKDSYTEQNNFRNFFNSVVLLIRSLTGEDWNGVMYDLAGDEPYEDLSCVRDQTYSDMQEDGVLGCGSWIAYPYFISFFVINAVIILDLSIGVFINALTDAEKYKNSIISRERIKDFVRKWGDYDPDATGWIDVKQLIFLIYELPSPLGLSKTEPEYKNVYKFDHIYSKLVHENLVIVKSKVKDSEYEH